VIEPDEMIDVRMGDEHVGQLEDLSHAQRINATEVEEHSPSLIVKPDEENRIFKHTVDETRREPIGHDYGVQPLLHRRKAD
jgi:hypothetical protein